jgi:hypothetical protein
LQRVGVAVELWILLMEESSFPFDDYDGAGMDFGTGLKLMLDPVYCKGTATVLKST